MPIYLLKERNSRPRAAVSHRAFCYCNFTICSIIHCFGQKQEGNKNSENCHNVIIHKIRCSDTNPIFAAETQKSTRTALYFYIR